MCEKIEVTAIRIDRGAHSDLITMFFMYRYKLCFVWSIDVECITSMFSCISGLLKTDLVHVIGIE